MKFKEMVSIIVARMGNRTDLRTTIEAEADFTKTFTLEKDPSILPWFLLQEDEALAYTAGVAYVALPTGWLGEYEDTPMQRTAGGIAVQRRMYGDALQVYTDTDGSPVTGTQPLFYAIRGDRIYFFPTPTASGTLAYSYYKASGSLVDAPDDHPWLLHAGDWLLNETGAVVAQQEQHTDAFQIFQTRAVLARQRLIGSIEERRMLGGL